MSDIFDLSKKIDSGQVANELKTRKENFKTLLDTVNSLDDKKKFLWLDIYTNAFKEIDMAYRLFNEAYASFDTSSEVSHAEVGPILVKYLERASKANEQLLKLANMLEEAEGKSEETALDDIRAARSKFKGRI
jgi:hypothetical protein